MQQNIDEGKRVLTEVIKRQMAILGPDITLAKVKNVPGLEVDVNGEVTHIQGDTRAVLQALINQFVELSGLIVKKTMESIIMSSSDGAEIAAQQMGVGTSAAQLPVEPAQQPDRPPLGYVVGETSVSESNPQQTPQQNQQTENMQSANRDLEDLNKMLNNIKS